MSGVYTNGFIPNESEILLLKAALWSKPKGIDCWQLWKSAIEHQHLSVGCRQIIPLLYRNLVNLGVNDPVMDEYRARYQLSATKSDSLLERTGPVINSIQESGIVCTILKGSAARYLYYDDPYTRTMSDIDMLVPMEQYAATRGILIGAGIKPLGAKERYGKLIPIRHGATFRSGDGIKVDVHWHTLQVCCNSESDEVFREDTRILNTPHFNAITISDTLQLLHTIVHASQRVKQKTIRWVCDASKIIQQGNVRWEIFTEYCERLGVVPCVIDALEFLQQKMEVAIPQEVISELRGYECSVFRLRELKAHSSPRGRLGSFPMLWHKYAAQQVRKGESRRLGGYLSYVERWCGVDSFKDLVRFLLTRRNEDRLNIQIPGTADVMQK